ncbi:MAG: MerR family transcriptional regulator [Actinomycetota bacterium]|nr:MerR family transcriptional regulator [Actinomycetota bacterium]
MDDSQTMGIGDLARLTGLTVRTLHHYDEIGLLVPSGRTSGGYREYDGADVDRLRQIVAYRACGLALTDIAEVLDAPGTEQAGHLQRQMALLDKRIEELRRQRAVLGRTWEAKQMGIALDPEEYFEVFGESDPRQYADEVQERWGDTDAYAESHRRTSGFSKEDWLRAQEQTAAVEAEFGACMAAYVHAAIYANALTR